MANCESTSDPIEQAINQAMWCNVPKEEINSVIAWVQESLSYERENIEKLWQTIEYIWNDERIFVIDFFWLSPDPQWFVEWVTQIQAALGFPENQRDGIIWPNTLAQIYTRYYQWEYTHLPEVQKTRLDIYNQMQNYPDRDVYNADWEFIRSLSVSTKPNPFDDRRYWGWESFDNQNINPVDSYRPIHWTMFANGIIDKGFDTTLKREANTIYIEVFQWKHIISLYNSDGQCELVTYTSPWDASRGANGRYDINASSRTNMHHMSNDLNGAPMPYGINVSDWNIMIHSWVWVVNGDYESAGCYRVALAYGSHIFKRVREMWNFQLIANI